MALPGFLANSSRAGWTSLLWQGRCLAVWSLKMGLPQQLCGFCLSQKLLASVVHTLTCADYFHWSLGTKMSPAVAETKPSRARQTSILWSGRCPDISSPKRGLPQKLCGSRLSQKLLASVVHTLNCADYFRQSPGTLYLTLSTELFPSSLQCVKHSLCQAKMPIFVLICKGQ